MIVPPEQNRRLVHVDEGFSFEMPFGTLLKVLGLCILGLMHAFQLQRWKPHGAPARLRFGRATAKKKQTCSSRVFNGLLQ